MADLGYGCKAFIISLVENAVKVSKGKVSAYVIAQIIGLGKSLLHLDAKPLEGVEETLALLHEKKKEGRGLKLAVFTKGELQDQENKLWRSGLQRYFDVVSIVSDKSLKLTAASAGNWMSSLQNSSWWVTVSRVILLLR